MPQGISLWKTRVQRSQPKDEPSIEWSKRKNEAISWQ